MDIKSNMALSGAYIPASGEMLQQAAEWHAHLQSGEATSADHEAFEAWQAAHPEHASIYQKLSALWSDIETVDMQAGKATLKKILPAKRKNSIRKTAGSLLGLVFVFLASWMGIRAEYTQYYLADYRSKTGEQLQVTLSDSSEVMLDTQSAINVDFNANVRNIALVKGALFIDVAKDGNRPLVVKTEFGSAQALGTQFIVEKNTDAMTVAVKESHVKVCAQDSQTLCVTLAPGEEVDVGRNHISSIRQVDPVIRFAWTKGNLIADNLPLTTLLDRLSRYKTGHLSYDAEALKDIRVSGVFKLTEVDQTLQYLSETVAIRVETEMPYWTSVQPK